jgi:hypothetical protein
MGSAKAKIFPEMLLITLKAAYNLLFWQGKHQDIVWHGANVKVHNTCHHQKKWYTRNSLQIMFAKHDQRSK